MGGSGRWKELFERVKQLDQEREGDALARDEAATVLREFEAWCESATDQVMSDVAEVAKKRSAEFEERTGHRIEVTHPSHEAIHLGENGPHMTFMRFSLEGSNVHLYSYRAPGTLPAIHMVHTDEERLPRHRRLVSQPGCYLTRTADEGYRLRRVGDDGDPNDATTADDLVFRGFDLLVRSLPRARPGEHPDV